MAIRLITDKQLHVLSFVSAGGNRIVRVTRTKFYISSSIIFYAIIRIVRTKFFRNDHKITKIECERSDIYSLYI